jgi:3-oxoacyl-[acyl-carrier protein] reductase
MARRFVAEGALVVVHGRHQPDAVAAAESVGAELALSADVSDPVAAQELIDAIVTRLGRIDVVVNNAGVSAVHAITRVTDEDWQRIIGMNLSGSMYVSRAAVKHMKRDGGGGIVNVVSWAGVQGTSGMSACAASKGGLVALTLTWAKELAAFGIRVNALSPAAMSDMLRELPPDVLQARIEQRRLGLPTTEAVADAAVFLVSDVSKYTTGQVLFADGGAHLGEAGQAERTSPSASGRFRRSGPDGV